MNNKPAKKLKKSSYSYTDNLPYIRTGIAAISFKKIFLISAIQATIISYYIYTVMMTPPNLPTIDLDEYWGPYPMNPNQSTSIKQFKIEFSDVMINDLRERLLHRRPFQPPLEGAGFTYGFNSDFLTRVLDYWKNKYDFKERERFFNKYNHYMTNIQGLDIHYIHVKPEVTPDIEVCCLCTMYLFLFFLSMN